MRGSIDQPPAAVPPPGGLACAIFFRARTHAEEEHARTCKEVDSSATVSDAKPLNHRWLASMVGHGLGNLASLAVAIRTHTRACTCTGGSLTRFEDACGKADHRPPTPTHVHQQQRQTAVSPAWARLARRTAPRPKRRPASIVGHRGAFAALRFSRRVDWLGVSSGPRDTFKGTGQVRNTRRFFC